MPRTCTLCARKDRPDIDAALVEGSSFRDIAGRFRGTSKSAIERHAAHVPKQLALAKEAKSAANGDDLLGKVAGLERDAHRLRDVAERDQDIRAALAAVSTLAKLVELQSRLLAEVKEKEVDVLALILRSPEWSAIEGRFAEAANRRPELREILLWVASGEGTMPAEPG